MCLFVVVLEGSINLRLTRFVGLTLTIFLRIKYLRIQCVLKHEADFKRKVSKKVLYYQCNII